MMRALNFDYDISKLLSEGYVDKSQFDIFNNWSSDWLAGGSGSSSDFNFGLDGSDLHYNPIGAFYESRTLERDNAASIANKTLVLLDSQRHGLTTAQLAALDANHDGQLSGSELAGLSAWADLNENGVLDADEKRGLLYSTRIQLKQDRIQVGGQSVALSPGMAVRAEVKTDKRKVIDYFLSPLKEYANESLGER
jgi:hypothetical protein